MARSNLLFVLLLVGGTTTTAFATEVVRGPYLQIGTPTTVVVKWRTDEPTDSAVHYGTELGTQSLLATDTELTTEHTVQITGLTPDTKYYYSIGSTAEVLAGADSLHFFVTAPLSGTMKPTRIWILGDSGTKNDNARAVRDAYYNFTGDKHTDLWLMLGDNAYNGGSDDSYQKAVFEKMYEAMLRKSVLWPTLGNHDDNTMSTPGPYPYYDIFDLPIRGEAGGIASGTEAYFSFDYGNIHFINLNSTTSDLRSPSSAMWVWLEEDLAANLQDWTIAFWHHPPYSKGSHDSDREGDLIEMRERALPLLEEAGVDLVLNGHSHSYERSFLLDGHYGKSNTLTPKMKLDDGDGRPDGDGAYKKATFGPAPHEGAVYIVAGSSGKVSKGDLDHPVMVSSLKMLGSVVLDIDGNSLDAKFIDHDGNVSDYFSLVKEGSRNRADFSATPTTGVMPLEVAFTNKSVGAIDGYRWDFGDGNSSTDVSPTHVYTEAGTYTVSLVAMGVAGSDTTWQSDLITVLRPGERITTSFQDGVSGYEGARDTELRESSETSNLGDRDEIEVDGSPGHAALLYWDLLALPPGSQIQSAAVTLEVINPTDDSYDVYAVKRPWQEEEATWTEYAAGQSWELPGAAGDLDRDAEVLGSLTASTAGGTTFVLNSAGVQSVQEWVDNPWTNQGLVLQNYLSARDKLEFWSREAGDPAVRPKLTLTYVIPEPVSAEFSAAPLNGTALLQVAFFNASTGEISGYEWEFGDGGTSTDANPTHLYEAPGSYTVTLSATGPFDSATKTRVGYITVSPAIEEVTTFFQDGLDGYMGTRDADIRSDSRDLNFGEATKLGLDGNPDLSTLLRWDVSSVPAGSVVESASITVNVVDGSRDQYSIYEMKRPWIENEVTWDQSSVGQPWQVEGAAGADDRGSEVLSSITSPISGLRSFDFNAEGVALIQRWIDQAATNTGLIILNHRDTVGRLEFNSREAGTGMKRPKLSVTYAITPPPLANFGASDTSGTAPLEVNFHNRSVGDIGAYLWDFGDGQTSAEANPVHIYTASGDYSVALTASGRGGENTHIKQDYIVVAEPPPIADFEGDVTSGVVPVTVRFLDKSTGALNSYAWDFGDGNLSSEQNPERTYSVPGSYTVSLTATGPGGTHTQTKASYVTVSPKPLTTASFQHGSQGYAGARDTELRSGSPNTNYGGSSKVRIDGAPDIAALFYWDISGIPATSVVDSVSMTLDVVNTSDEPYHLYALLRPWVEGEANWLAPRHGENWSTAGANGFDDRSSVELGTTLATSSGPNTIHFNADGVTVIQSWIDDPTANHGLILANYDSAKNRLEVLTKEAPAVEQRPNLTLKYDDPAAPIADFEASPREGAVPLEVPFSNLTQGVASSYLWDFGDGTSSAEENPLHVYTTPGLYSVKLIARGVSGADTTLREDYVTAVRSGPLTISFQEGDIGYTGMEDTELRSSLPDSNLGSAGKLALQGSPARSVILRWDLESVPVGSKIESVALAFNVVNPSPDSYNLYHLTRPWSESQASWDSSASGSSWEVAGANGTADRGQVSLGSLLGASSGLQEIALNEEGVGVVQSWVDDPASNEGFVLLSYDTTAKRLEFSSSEAAEINQRPRISITYQVSGTTPKYSRSGKDETSKRQSTAPPFGFELKGNYPNPFNPSTVIAYSLAKAGKVELVVYDILGREVATLVSGLRNAGEHKVVFDARGLATGSYFVRLKSAGLEVTRRMLFAK